MARGTGVRYSMSGHYFDGCIAAASRSNRSRALPLLLSVVTGRTPAWLCSQCVGTRSLSLQDLVLGIVRLLLLQLDEMMVLLSLPKSIAEFGVGIDVCVKHLFAKLKLFMLHIFATPTHQKPLLFGSLVLCLPFQLCFPN